MGPLFSENVYRALAAFTRLPHLGQSFNEISAHHKLPILNAMYAGDTHIALYGTKNYKLLYMRWLYLLASRL